MVQEYFLKYMLVSHGSCTVFNTGFRKALYVSERRSAVAKLSYLEDVRSCFWISFMIQFKQQWRGITHIDNLFRQHFGKTW